MANINILITSNDATNDIVNRIKQPTDNTRLEANSIVNYVAGLAAGVYNGKLDVQVQGSSAAYASGTVTCASTVATNTVTINGVVFTAVASGATGNQFNIGANDTATAANIAAAVNGSVSAAVKNVVTASSSGTVVTLQAFVMGPIGNICTLASSGATVAVSGATLTGGAYTANIYSYGM